MSRFFFSLPAFLPFLLLIIVHHIIVLYNIGTNIVGEKKNMDLDIIHNCDFIFESIREEVLHVPLISAVAAVQ